MDLSRLNMGPGVDPRMSWLAKLVVLLRKSAVWVLGISFAVLAAVATFFFALAAIIGTFVLAGAVALAWFLFKLIGPKNFRPKTSNPSHPTTLDATRGPKGWTVNGQRPFDR
ncbi:MAG: hypothetical protein JKX99_10165 [Robiginitomaculum sp.]|nr:hypothetical protein [Robiginitomaculum sp.]